MFSSKCLCLSGGFSLPLWVKINILSPKSLMTDRMTTHAGSVGATEVLAAQGFCHKMQCGVVIREMSSPSSQSQSQG